MWIVAGSTVEDWVHRFDTYEEALEYYEQLELEPGEDIYIAEVKDHKSRSWDDTPIQNPFRNVSREEAALIFESFAEGIKETLNDNTVFDELFKKK